MSRIEPISLPPKSAFGFWAPLPFFGANSQFRKKIKRELLVRASFKAEIEAAWASSPFSPEEIRDILDCIRVNNGWPNALFLPSDSFLALAPLEISRYDAFTADCDTVNGLYFILDPAKREKKGIMAGVKRSLVAGSDIPLADISLITPESTIADVLEMIAAIRKAKETGTDS